MPASEAGVFDIGDAVVGERGAAVGESFGPILLQPAMPSKVAMIRVLVEMLAEVLIKIRMGFLSNG